MHHREFGWKTADGLRIFAQEWQGEGDPAKLICGVHGMGEHSGRYAHVAAHLTRAGYAMLAFDLRGHGQSEGPRGHSPSYQAMMDDIAHFLEETAERIPDVPRFLYGHSLGGNLVLNFVLRRRPRLTAVVATSPGLRPATAPARGKLLFGRIMSKVWPRLALANGLEVRGLSRDPEVVRAYQEDPLNHDRLTVRFGIDVVDAGSWALKHAAEFPLPLLLMHGDADRLTSAPASREFAAGMGEHCTLKIWPGGYHELHNEPEKEKVLAEITTWLEGLG